jgi:hypothetical protein
MALPVYPELTDEQQDYVVNMIAEFFGPNHSLPAKIPTTQPLPK